MLSKKQNICSLLAIFFIAVISYFNSFENSFHFDDDKYVVNNIIFKEYLESPYHIKNFFREISNRYIVTGTIYLNYSISGFEVFGFHVFNLLIHLLTCLFVFLLLVELCEISPPHLFKKKDRWSYKINIPLAGAMLFAVHPMNTQAVTYITSRSSLLAACFYIASFLFFIKGIRNYTPAKLLFFFLSLVFFVAGYGSKSIVITAPIIFIVYCLFFTSFLKDFFDNRPAKIILKSTILLSPLILILLSRIINLKYIISLNLESFPKIIQLIQHKLSFIVSLSEKTISSSSYLLTEFKVMVFYYIRMILFPFNQNIDPDFPIARHIMDHNVVLSVLIIILFLFAGVILHKNNRLIAFGIFWFFITLLPTSSFLPLQDTAVEHRLYLPLTGAALIVPLVIQNLFCFSNNQLIRQKAFPLLFIFLSITMFSALTAKRNFVWNDEKSLWLDAANKSPKLSRPFNNLGEAYDKEKDYKKAIDAFKKAILNSPNNYKPYNNLGKIYGKLRQLDLAEENLKYALRLKSDYPIGRYNLAKIYESKGNFEYAIKEYSLAFKQKYDFFEACFNLANVYSKIKEYSKAIETYNKCEKFRSSYPKTYLAIGDAYLKSGNIDKALEYVSTAVELDDNYIRAKIVLAGLFTIKKNFNKAEIIYKQILNADPMNFNAHNSLGMLLLRHLNNPGQAVFHFKKSLEIKPDQQNAPLIKAIMNHPATG